MDIKYTITIGYCVFEKQYCKRFYNYLTDISQVQKDVGSRYLINKHG